MLGEIVENHEAIQMHSGANEWILSTSGHSCFLLISFTAESFMFHQKVMVQCD